MTNVIPMSGELEHRQPGLELARYVSPDGLDQIQRALPEGVSLARFDTALATAMLTLPELQKCDRTSLFLALVRCASRGLLPDGVEAAIVPFNNKRKGIVEATFIEMIRGTRHRFAIHGWLLTASVVHAADAFAIDKGDGRVTHSPTLSGDPGPVIGAWAKATHRDGRRRAADYMTIEQIQALAQQMNVSERELWKKWPDQAAEKTVAHRLANDIGLADEDRERGAILNATELEIVPEDPAEMLYGPGASFSEVPSGVQPAPPAGGVADSDTPSPVDDVQHPGGGGHEGGQPPLAAAASPAPGVDVEEAMLAADYVPPVGKYTHGGEQGPRTLAEIHEAGDDAFLRAAAARAPDEVFRAKAAAYVAVYLDAEAA